MLLLRLRFSSNKKITNKAYDCLKTFKKKNMVEIN